MAAARAGACRAGFAGHQPPEVVLIRGCEVSGVRAALAEAAAAGSSDGGWDPAMRRLAVVFVVSRGNRAD